MFRIMRLFTEILLFMIFFCGWLVADLSLRSKRTKMTPRRALDPVHRDVPFSTCTQGDEREGRSRRLQEIEEEVMKIEVVQNLVVVLSSLLIALSWFSCVSILMHGRRMVQLRQAMIVNMAAAGAFEGSRRRG